MTPRTQLLFGWIVLAVFIAGGLALETLHLFKAPFYFEVEIRRELWVLGHAHGALLGIVNVIAALTLLRLEVEAAQMRWPIRLLMAAAVLVPAGFLLGGIGNSESDPSLWILLTPIGAIAALVGVIQVALRVRRS